LELSGGRLTLANESALERIQIERLPGENPKLISAGKPQPFAEVLPEEGKGRLIGNHSGEFSIDKDIFSVEGKTVNIRNTPSSFSSDNIVGSVHKGNMVVALAEDDGWYQVKVAQSGKIIDGWVNAAYLLPLIASDSSTRFSRHSKNEPQAIIVYPDKTKIQKDLVGKSMRNWAFYSTEEFQDFNIEQEQVNGNTLSQKITTRLKNKTNGRQFLSEIMVSYEKRDNQWNFNSVSQLSMSEVYNTGSYSNPLAQTAATILMYNVGDVLQYHPVINLQPVHYENSQQNTCLPGNRTINQRTVPQYPSYRPLPNRQSGYRSIPQAHNAYAPPYNRGRVQRNPQYSPGQYYNRIQQQPRPYNMPHPTNQGQRGYRH